MCQPWLWLQCGVHMLHFLNRTPGNCGLQQNIVIACKSTGWPQETCLFCSCLQCHLVLLGRGKNNSMINPKTTATVRCVILQHCSLLNVSAAPPMQHCLYIIVSPGLLLSAAQFVPKQRCKRLWHICVQELRFYKEMLTWGRCGAERAGTHQSLHVAKMIFAMAEHIFPCAAEWYT